MPLSVVRRRADCQSPSTWGLVAIDRIRKVPRISVHSLLRAQLVFGGLIPRRRRVVRVIGVLDHVIVDVQTATPSIQPFFGLPCAVERTLRTRRSFLPWNPGSTAAPAVATAAAMAAA